MSTPSSISLSPRWGHGSALFGSKMYLLGGNTKAGLTSQVLHVDLDKPFSTQSPPYVQNSVNDTANVFVYAGCKILAAGPVIRCIGGANTRPASVLLDLMFHVQASKWIVDVPSLGPPPSPRLGHGLVLSGNSYFLFGGSLGSLPLDSPFQRPDQLTNELWRLDIATNAWTRIATSGLSPPPVTQMTFTSLRVSPHLLVSLGGIDSNGNLLSIQTAWVFNTQTLAWRQYAVGGDKPANRRAHASCSVSNFIYSHGGTDARGASIYSDLNALVYSVHQDSFTWNPIYRPKLDDFKDTKFPVGRSFHQLSCTSKHVFVTFGFSAQRATDDVQLGMAVFPNDGASSPGPISALHLYDIDLAKDGGWTTQFNPPPSADQYGDINPNVPLPETLATLLGDAVDSINSTFWTVPVIVGMACGAVALMLVIAGYLFYIRVRDRKRNSPHFTSLRKSPVVSTYTPGTPTTYSHPSPYAVSSSGGVVSPYAMHPPPHESGVKPVYASGADELYTAKNVPFNAMYMNSPVVTRPVIPSHRNNAAASITSCSSSPVLSVRPSLPTQKIVREMHPIVVTGHAVPPESMSTRPMLAELVDESTTNLTPAVNDTDGPELRAGGSVYSVESGIRFA